MPQDVSPCPQTGPGPATDTTYTALDAGRTAGTAALTRECALAVTCNGISQVVMMVSPEDLEDFAVGFSLASALVPGIEDIHDLVVSGDGDALSADLSISGRAFWALRERRRAMAGTTGCGLCGVESLSQALPTLSPLTPAPLPPAAHLADLRQRLPDHQVMARVSGAMHGALFVDTSGRIRLCREDIGRHNALDKLIGALYRQRFGVHQGFAVITSRCSLELIQKAVRAGLGTLVTLSAPTELSVRWARELNLNLIHLPWRGEPRVFSPAAAGMGT